MSSKISSVDVDNSTKEITKELQRQIIANFPDMFGSLSKRLTEKTVVKAPEEKKIRKNEFLFGIFVKMPHHFIDFYFTFVSGERVPVHKFVLSAGSAIFLKNFNGEWKGKTETEVTDVSAAAFMEFIQFFYSNKVKLTMKNISEVMNLCKKYEMDECLAGCVQFIKQRLNDENVIWAYEIAIKNNVDELKKCCELIIGYNLETVSQTEGFKTCSHDVIANILEMKEAFCCKEFDLFEACMTWVKGVSKQNELTKEIVYTYFNELYLKVRFGLMTISDARRIIQTYGKLYSTDDFRNTLKGIVAGKFNDQVFCEPRNKPSEKSKWNDQQLIIFEQLPFFSSLCNKQQTLKKIGTTVLVGIEFDMSDQKFKIDENIPTEVTIFEIDPIDSSEKIVLKREKGFLYQTHYYYKMMFPKMVFIKPKMLYKIQMEQTPSENCRPLQGYNLLNISTNVSFRGDDIETGFINNDIVKSLIFIEKF